MTSGTVEPLDARDLTVPHRAVSSPGPQLLQAALLLAVYSVLCVVLNGIALDETVIAAQVITGAVEYPAGHPHAIYYPRIFSLPHYLSALAWLIYPSAEAISAVRNMIFLFMSTFATFAVTFALTRRAAWGWVAVALLVAEVSLRFDGLYPLWVFPFIYSNGQIGLQLTVLILALVLLRMWRSSAFLLGLLPAIHASFALLLWPWALLLLLARKLYREPVVLRRILAWGGLGIAFCAVLYVLIQVTTHQPPAVAPYDTITANGALIRQRFLTLTDVHRQPIRIVGFSYLVNPVAFFVLASLLWTRSRAGESRKPDPAPERVESREADAVPMESWRIAWVGVLGIMVWVYVYGTRIWQALPAGLPESVSRTMPARYSNITAVLIVSVTVALLASGIAALGARRRSIALAMLASILLAAAVIAAPWVVPPGRNLIERNLLVLVWGLAFAIEWAASSGKRRALVAAALAVVTAALLPFWSSTRVAAYAVGSAAFFTLILSRPFAELVAGRLLKWLPGSRPAALLLPGAILLALTSLPGHGADRGPRTRWDIQDDDSRAIGAWLSENARRDEPVLTGFAAAELQVKTGQPVLFEEKTLYIMSYMPDLAPVIGVMARDLYDVDYENPAALTDLCAGGMLSTGCPVWNAAWERRTVEDWRNLGDRYDFRLVLAAANVKLNLPAVVTGRRWSLYTIP